MDGLGQKLDQRLKESCDPYWMPILIEERVSREINGPNQVYPLERK